MCIVYLASPRDHHIYNDSTQASRLELLEGSLRIARRLFPTTDILIFHEDFTEREILRLSSATQFIQVTFAGEEAHYNSSLRRPYGYMMMCRFFSGQLQRHPALSKYTHYMRLDDDSYFEPPFLSESDIPVCDYVYRSLFYDKQDQQSLWEFTLDFLRKEGYGSYIGKLKSNLRTKKILVGDQYTGAAPYNNFHVASLQLWNSPLIRRYIDALETSHGILRHGWMDANIHAMVIFVLSLFGGFDVRTLLTFGYRHNLHRSTLDSLNIVYDSTLPFTAEAKS